MVIFVVGYVLVIGFVYIGKFFFFVYDIVDIIKFDIVVLKVFEIVCCNSGELDWEVCLVCRDIFCSSKILVKLILFIEDVFVVGEI